MEIVFCERCGVSIPEHQVAGSRQASGGRDLCATCSGPGTTDGDLPLYFCENCRVSIAVSEVITGGAQQEGSGYLCGVCSRSSPAERMARRTAVERELHRGAGVPGPGAARPGPSPDPLYFCDACNASIPAAVVATGRALVRGGRTYCEHCRARAERPPAASGVGAVAVLAAALLAAGATAGGFAAWEAWNAPARPGPEEVARLEVSRLRAELRGEFQGAEAARAALGSRVELATDSLEKELEGFRAELRGVRESTDRLGGMIGADRGESGNRIARLEERMISLEQETRGAVERLSREVEERLVKAVAEVAAAGAAAPPPPPDEGTGSSAPEPRTLPPGGTPPAGPSDAVLRSIEMLKDKDAGQRFAAAIELGKLGDTRAWKALVDALKADDDVFVRRACVRSLGELKAYDAFPDLVEALMDPEEYVAKQASMVIREMAGQDFGYKQNQARSDRRRVADRAKKWWEENRDRLAGVTPAAGGPAPPDGN